MSDLDRSLQVRAFLESWSGVFLAVLLVLAAVGGWWSYQVHATQDIEREEVVVEQWSESTTYEHSAVITNDSLVFEEGERVRNRPVYYVNLTRELEVTYAYEHTAETGSVNVTTDVRLQYRGVEGDTVLWQYAEPLASGRDEGVTNEDNHTVSTAIEIDAVFETIRTIERQLGAAGTIEIRIVAASSVEGTLAGQSVSETYESTMPMTVNPQTFRVLEMNTVDESGQRTETVEQPVDPGTTEAVGSILLVLLGVGGAAGLLLAQRSGYATVSPEEREILEIRQQEQEFSEWITRGTFPSERDYEATILVDDLEGLVDVAIDTNKRVIKDEQLGVSSVLDGDFAYLYVRPDSPASDWLVNYADMTMDEFDRFDG
ncbi:DUF5305 domain-containing protein [Halorubrum ezzemoulense]|uniref:DUF5305 domain-containing protein n=1 Tax=Halorubrum ezzemoulense TaxID=337243 RepID=UPI00232E5C6D|nr:DUF5305 domain-containing protein [Halorubrum ezzemoulense]MDB9233664.1 DUF5305 domain-containing protein [Halorubrum ezzemoulense]MDB9252625.1 DUF5305 domain-containing protein [Halorubrum ezzemoulense]MDB9255259.1 DUF5305 domain-containing protein [Halorubrum ezzemoulense]MDB9275970.1 DUF5305 domain-containing protein [Halorubrum ezzemoulense]